MTAKAKLYIYNKVWQD